MTPYVRYRACIDTVYISGIYRVDIAKANGAATPLNLVTLTPNWSPLGTHVDLIQLAGEGVSPTTGLLGTDSPQSSISHTIRPYASNPATPGLYARWMTEMSSADSADGTLNFVLSTSCKAIGAPVGGFPDADHDCQLDTLEGPSCVDSGWPGTPATTIAGNPDSDNDGIPDGIEVAWGSDPCRADTDAFTTPPGDGRTDLEEMVGPTQFLTDPTKRDTDGDTVPDGGQTLDATGDGVPDFPDVNGDGVKDLVSLTPPMPVGWQLVDSQADGSSHVRIGYKIVGTDIEKDAGGMDNCPSIANPTQVNTDLDSATTWGHGDLYGDACDSDWDNDGFVNTAEVGFQWDAGNIQCSNDKDLPGAATPLDPYNPDTDGDGILDGPECENGSNPLDAADTPGAPAVDTDKDVVSNAYETFKRTQGFSNQPVPPVGSEDVDGDTLVGQADPDSDNDTLSDGCEIFVTGTNPLMTDTDANGTPDASEPNIQEAIKQHCIPSQKYWTITRGVAGDNADDMELTFTIPSGTTIGAVAAGAGTSSCKWAAGVLTAGAQPYKVKWSSLCVANGQTVDVRVNYTSGGDEPRWTRSVGRKRTH